MSYISCQKMDYYRERLRYQQWPITADVFLTDFCQLRCGYCRYKKSDGYMTIGIFRGVLDRLQALGVRGVVLTGGGEPLLNPDFLPIVRELEIRGVPYGVNTNFVDPVFEMSPRFVKVSIDAATPADYLRLRGVDRFRRVVENVRRFAIVKDPETVLGVQAVIYKRGQAGDFYTRFSAEPVDYISMRPLETRHRIYAGNELLLREVRRFANTPRVITSYKWDYIDRRYPSCLNNWAVITVDHRGDVLYCCNKHDEVVGSVFDRKILDKKRRWQTDMSTCEVPCRLSGVNDAADREGVAHVEFV